MNVHICLGIILYINLSTSYAFHLWDNEFNSFMDKNKIYLWKSATNLTSAMTILCSIIMCFRSLSCSSIGKCSSQKIQGTDGEPSKAVVPPGLSGRESGSRIQSLLSGREKKQKQKREKKEEKKRKRKRKIWC